MCNDIHEVYRTLGIEAARACLLREFFIAYDRSGNTINTQHLSIFADIITGTGILVSIDRHGINKTDTDPLSRASFEKTVEQLITAATFGEVDHVNGVSSRVMVGQVIKGGTGICDLMLDEEMIENSEYVEDQTVKFKEINPNSIIKDVIKKKPKKTFMPEDD
jgi:DNA-directed RNA polymerase II subunit RPB1